MLVNFSKPHTIQTSQRNGRWRWWVLVPLWTYAAFLLAELVVFLAVQALVWLGLPLLTVNQVLLTTVASVTVYLVAMLLVTVLPWLLWRRRTTRRQLGVASGVAWWDVALTPLAYVAYLIGTALVMAGLISLFPQLVDLKQPQQLPFSQSMLAAHWQYVLAFVTLVVLAPAAEEVLFRGYLYGTLRRTAPVWLAVVLTSLTFGLAHLWAGPDTPLQWAVAIDTALLSIVLCLTREYTGAIWTPVFIHMIKNGLAFYLLFVNPTILQHVTAGFIPGV